MIRQHTDTHPTRAEVFAEGAVTVTEAARFSGLGRTLLYALMTTGRLPSAKVGARRLIARRGLIELLAAGADPDAG